MAASFVRGRLEVIAAMLGKQPPKVEQMLREAKDDLLAFTGFPVSHWKKVWSTNPLEWLNKEVKRRTDVVGVFPNPAALLRWPARSSSRPTTSGKSPPNVATPPERSMALLTAKNAEEVARPELMTA